MNRMRDTSSSSSEDEIEKRDEASFQKGIIQQFPSFLKTIQKLLILGMLLA